MFVSCCSVRAKLACTWVLLTAMTAGCASSVPSGTVSGSVKVKDKSAKAGTVVTFVSEKGDTATGVVAADGTYQLRSIGTAKPENIPAGNYKVAVAAASDTPAMTDEDYEKMMNSGGKAPEVKKDNSIPAKYGTPQTSGLTFEVKTGANTFDIVVN